MATTVSTIHINGKEAENTLKGLTSLANRFSNELRTAELGTEEFNKKLEEFTKYKLKIEEQKKALKEYIDTYGKTAPMDKSLNRMREQHRELVKELDNLEVGTKQWLAQLAKVKDSESNLNKINAQIKDVGKTTDSFGSAVTRVGGMMAGAFAAESIIHYADELRKTAIMLDTYDSKTQTVFAESTRIVEDSATKQAADIGLARSQYKLLATDIGDLLVPLGFQREEAARMSTQLVDMSGALAEWSGGQKTATEISGSLRKALMGEFEELESVGVKLSADIVKSKLASEGKAKLTGAALEQAKATAILSLIMEKSQDAQTAFANNQDSLARQSARLSASFQTIKETLAASLIPFFERATTTIANFITQNTNYAAQVDKQANIVSKLEKNLSPLLNRYEQLTKKTKLSKEEQVELKGIIQKIAEYTPTAITQVDNYGNALAINAAKSREFLETEKARLKVINKDAIEGYEKESKRLETLIAIRKNIIEKGSEGFAVGDDVIQVNLDSKRVQEIQSELKQFSETLKGVNAEKERLSGDNFKINEIKPNTGNTGNSGAAIELDKELEKQLDALKRLKENIKNFNTDIAQLNATQDQAEEIRIREKYEKQIAIAAELLKSKYPSVVKQANDVIKELTNQADAEIIALQGKHLRELETNLKAHQNDVAAMQISDDEKAIQRIRDRYAKEIAESIALESSKNETIAQKAREARAALQAALDAEIAVEEQKQAETKQQKEIEELDKDLQRRLKTEQEYNQFTGNLQQQELDQLEVQYLNIVSLAEKEGRDVNTVTEAYLKKKQDITDKYNKERVKREKENIEIIKEAEINLKLAKIDALQQGANALRQIVGESTALGKALFLFEKSLAISQIIMNAQLEKAKIAVQYAGNPIAIGIWSTIATIRAAASIATIGAQSVAQFTAPQKFMGGYHAVQGQTDGQTYKARYIGQPNTGMLPPSPSLVLASERGPEYFVSNEALSRPDVSWHVNAIDNIMKYTRAVPQFAEGGFTAPPSVSSATSNDPALVNVLSQLVSILGNGIEAKTVIGYKDVRDLRDAINRVQNIEN